MRLPVLAVFLLASCLGPGCSRERMNEMQEIPRLADLSPELRRAFEPGPDFEPVPEPAFGDWLQQHPEKGQTFEQFVRSEPLRPDGRRNKLYLQPLGAFSEDAPSLDLLERFAEAFFALDVEVLPVSRFEEGPQVDWRFHGSGRQHRQYLTGDILARLGKQIPRDAYALLGIIMEDIYPGPNWNYVFGMATLRKRVGIYSFARYDPAFYDEPRPADWRRLMLRRSCKVLAHEAGHMFGIHHCTAFTA